MITLYLSCLVVGGVFVALAALGAFGKDFGKDFGQDDALEADHAFDPHHALEADQSFDHAQALESASPTVADAAQGVAKPPPPKRKLWLPVLSFRFWTYGSAFFGLTGTLLTTLTAATAAFVAVASALTGLGVGTLSAWIVRFLRRPVGASIRLAEYSGQVGEVLLPLRAGGITRIRLRVHERERTMLAVAPDPIELAAGTRVLVLGIDERGRAQIEPEENVLEEKERVQ